MSRTEWQAPDFARARRALRQRAVGTEELLKEVPTLLRRSDPQSQVGAFTSCLALLQDDVVARRLGDPEREKIVRSAERILARNGVGTHGSRLSHLHDELFAAVSARLDVTALGELAEKKGHALVDRLRAIGEPRSWDERRERVRGLRWMADYFQAEAEIEALACTPHPEAAEFCARERLLQAIGRDADLARALPIGREDRELLLWAYAIPQRSFLARLPRGAQGLPGAFAAAYNLSLAKSVRWERLIAALQASASELSAHELALALAAGARWLLRSREKAAAQELLVPYGRLSLALTAGFTRDVLSLFTDRGASERESTAVPVAWQRAGALSSLSLEICLLLGKTRFASLFGREQQRKRLKDEEAAALVEICVRHFRELKGPVMKIGQTASYFGWQLPAISNEAMARLQSEGTPLAPAAVSEVMERELGGRISRFFSEFEALPCGVGSIGQVHRARLHSGEAVAVKVQFPGVREAVVNDLSLLRICFPIFRLLSAASMRRDLFDELEAELLRECDYRNEARVHAKLAADFRDAPGLRFPKLYPEVSTDKLLVTEWMTGRTFAEFVRQATQEERDHAAHWITELVVRGCCRGTFNSDPHPGNFLFADRQVVCLDFGAVKEWDPCHTIPWAEIILAGVKRDYPLFLRAVQHMGIIADRNNFNARYFFDVYTGGPMGNTAVDEQRCMRHEELHREIEGYFNRTFVGHLYFNPAYLYGVRVYTGLIAIVASLNAQNNFFAQIKSICEQTLPASSLTASGN